MTVYEEAHWLDVQLLTDVFADLDQVGTALTTLARCRFVAVLDTWQFRRQRLTTGALARRLGRCLAAQFLIDGREVHIDGLVEQHALFSDQCFTGLAEAHALVIGQLKRQRLDLEIIFGKDCIQARQLVVCVNYLGLLLREQRLHLRQQRWVDVGVGKFVEQVHS
jgi:hypothetical protein